MTSADDQLDDEPQDVVAADGTPDPIANPKSAKAWWALITRAETYFDSYQTACDNTDKWFANLEKLRSSVREREMQLFWANLQIMGPSIYSRPPVPVVVPAFKDKRELNRTASELLERCEVTTFRMQDVDAVMRQLRDDMMRLARGVVWMRFEEEGGRQSVCFDFKYRRDFLHDPARIWADVDWVAGAAYLSKRDMRKRFQKTSGDEYKNAAYAVVKDDVNGTLDKAVKAKVWELWSKSANKVVWIAEGCDKLLDEGTPHLDLESFWPCPRPAFGTLQPGTLLPIPDFLFWKDQAEEINELTGRIAALTESLRLKGFYAAGAGEIGDAIEAAMKNQQNNAILIPISNWAMAGGTALKDSIVWIPLADIANTIKACIEERKELISDVYQIMGISDIMRGDTDPDETKGAQVIKSQYGSVRVHDKQQELVRIARDMTRIAGEIMGENFSQKTLLDMSQMQLPTDAEIKAKVKPLQAELAKLVKDFEEAKSDPKIRQLAQAKPDVAKQVMEQAQQKAQGLQGQIQQLAGVVTIDAVMKFLRDNKMNPFTLDIETDSTIAPDEAGQQARAADFIKSVGGFLGQAMTMVEQIPQAAPVASAMLKFVASQYRVGREIEGVIDEFADQMEQIGQQPKGPSPEQQKAQADAQATQQQTELAQQKLQLDGEKQQLQSQLDAANVQLAQKNFELAQEQAKADAQLAALRLKLDQTVAAAKAANDQAQTDNEAIKHHSIEETKRRGQDLDAAVSIVDSLIAAKADNDGAQLEHALEVDGQLLGQQHEAEQMQTQHEHEIEMQDSVNQAAAAQGAAE